MWWKLALLIFFAAFFRLFTIVFENANEHHSKPSDSAKTTRKSDQASYFCDGVYRKYQPDFYVVYHSSSTDAPNYPAAIQKDIMPYIRPQLSDILRNKLVYRANDIDESMLSTIRSDEHVVLVQCGLKQEPIQDAATKYRYKAPLYCLPDNDRRHRIPGAYVIMLTPGWTLKKHFAAIKRDLTPYIVWHLDRNGFGRLEYHVDGLDDEHLIVIRLDEYVDLVLCNMQTNDRFDELK
ncbi:uncharacterized protein PAC_14031 [Phialocephala subalpina]|uniref:Uncharacterized protein n=1 Tax=Phialocephala subalpina TaxID=576137 RepID=A0A1L7XGJ0_9HELO|nr:uncharacterized protein PAC_14031 [Phialocephala subalpina]